jgi:hypothetical protein
VDAKPSFCWEPEAQAQPVEEDDLLNWAEYADPDQLEENPYE